MARECATCGANYSGAQCPFANEPWHEEKPRGGLMADAPPSDDDLDFLGRIG